MSGLTDLESERLFDYAEEATIRFDDEEYIDCYEDLISKLQSCVDAKREDMR